MLQIATVYLLFVAVQCHTNSDADMQSALMPQELNPAFFSDKESPWKAVLPLLRGRRHTDLTVDPTTPTVAETVKRYSRIVACLVLVASAITEVVLYLVEAYSM